MRTVRVWTGREASALRKALRLSVRDFAARLGVGVRTVSNWAAGQGAMTPRPEMQAALDTVLARATEGERARLALLLEEDDEEAATDRREFMAVAAGASSLLVARGAPAEACDDERLLLDVIAAYRRMERGLPSRALLPPVRAHLGLVAGHLARRPSRRFHAVVSEAAGLAAWLYLDMDETGNARRHYQFAARQAVRSGNWLLGLYMVVSAGHFEAEAGNPTRGLQLLREARREAHGRPLPEVAAIWMNVMEATVLAELHDERAYELLRSAERRLALAERSEPVWPWLFRFDAQKLATYQAQVSAKLGRAVAATAVFGMLEGYPPAPKQRALTELDYAKALADQGDMERACQVAERAVDTGRELRSDRVLHAAVRFRSGLPDRHSEPVVSFDQKLSAAFEVDA
ncbi:MAG: helix-turn-helix domain-containing protein [Micromonosporaceae bacterium]